MEKVSKWKLASTTKRTGSPIPEILIGTKDNLKINEAASRLLGIANKDYLSLINDNTEGDIVVFDKSQNISLTKGGDEVSYAICKGLPALAADGTHIETVEADGTRSKRFLGSKMSNPAGTSGFGILSGSDSKNWSPLGGNKNKNMVYEVLADEAVVMDAVDMYEGASDAIIAALEGIEVTIYPIRFSRTEDKIVRTRKNGVETEE